MKTSERNDRDANCAWPGNDRGGFIPARQAALSNEGQKTALARISAVRSRRRPLKPPATVIAARRLNRAAGMLALSVLADSGVEHYRGSFENKAMFTPLIVSALTLGTSIHGTADRRGVAHVVRDTTYLLAAATGLIGTGFHIYNVAKKAGGFSWQNLFYGAPLGAPMAILLSGLIGFCSERVRETPRGTTPTIFESSGRPSDGRGHQRRASWNRR